MPTTDAPGHRWLVSKAYDLGWFVAPGALALIVALVIGLRLPPSEDDSLALWIVGVLLVDVAHVWASLYRTYLDREARAAHRQLLRATPLVVLALAFMAHASSPRLFWGALAYVAVFHFIKQQEGFVALYLRAGGEIGDAARRDRNLAKAAIWASTAGPVLWWHAQLPRRFAWFMPEDFVAGLPAIVGTIAVWIQVPILIAFFVRRLQRRRHPMVPVLVALTAASWNLGIVAFDDGRVFTLTNVFLHGVPYMALVWIAGGAERVRSQLRPRAPLALVVAAFYGLIASLAIFEEALWDRRVWHDHPELFGDGSTSLDAAGLALAVAILSVPQATHYVLDRFIWRVGPKNPKLATQLGLTQNPQSISSRPKQDGGASHMSSKHAAAAIGSASASTQAW